MKKKVWFSAILTAAVLVLFLFGCALGLPEHGGSFEIKMPSSQAKAFEDGTAYVYLYQGNSLFRENPYTGQLLAGRGTVKVPNIPVGSNYNLAVILEFEGENNWLEYRFADARESIDVRKARETTVTLSEEDFIPVYYGRPDFAVVNGDDEGILYPVSSVVSQPAHDDLIFVVSQGILHSGLYYGDMYNTDHFNFGIPRVNSLSTDRGTLEAILLNTEEGLWTSGGNGYHPVYPPGQGETDNVLMSSSYYDLTILKTPTALVGSAYIPPSNEVLVWTRAELGTKRNVTDMFVYEGDDFSLETAFLATDFAGALALPMAFFALDFENHPPEYYLLNPEQLQNDYSEIAIYPFSKNPYWGDSRPRILSFGWNPGSDYEGGRLFIGTSNGLYVADSLDGKGLRSPPSFVEETRGLSITKVVVSNIAGVALLTPQGVFLSDPQSESPAKRLSRLPFLENWVGKVNDIALLADYNYPDLLVAGERGLVWLDVADWLLVYGE